MAAKDFIINKLRASPELKKINIGAMWHDSKKPYPQITVIQVISRPASYADDKPEFNEATVQVDVWHTGNPFPTADIVRNILAEEGFYANNVREVNEETVNRALLEYTLLEN